LNEELRGKGYSPYREAIGKKYSVCHIEY